MSSKRVISLTTTDLGLAELLNRLIGIEAEALKALIKGMDKANQIVIGQALRKRFTGKGPFPVKANKLGVVSGRLRKSIAATKAILKDKAITSRMGSKVKYFAVHEFGYKGNVIVPLSKVKSFEHPNAFGRGPLGILAHTRKAHSRRMNMPARAPLGTELRQSARIYLKQADRAIQSILPA